MKKYCINLDTSKFICCKVGWSPILSNARRIVDEILLCVSGTQAWLIGGDDTRSPHAKFGRGLRRPRSKNVYSIATSCGSVAVKWITVQPTNSNFTIGLAPFQLNITGCTSDCWVGNSRVF